MFPDEDIILLRRLLEYRQCIQITQVAKRNSHIAQVTTIFAAQDGTICKFLFELLAG